jgi:hypothetical protein
MPKVTDYVREGFRRRQRPWDRAELPEWWDVAVWVGGIAVVAVLVVSAVAGGGGSSDTSSAGDGGQRYAVQTLVPESGAVSAEPGAPTAPTAPAVPSPTASAPVQSNDFSASAAVQVPVTGGGTTVVPAGARNVALAAATAAATGDWQGIPFTGEAQAPAPSAPRGTLVGQVTVADPAVTGNSRYEFSATIQQAGTAQRSALHIVVERDTSGYAVRSL